MTSRLGRSRSGGSPGLASSRSESRPDSTRAPRAQMRSCGTAYSSEEAGGGNRTRVASLEGWSSTIELHPRLRCRVPSRRCTRMRGSRATTRRSRSALLAARLRARRCASSRPPRCGRRPSRARSLLLLVAFETPLETIGLRYLLTGHLLQNVILAEWAPALAVAGLPPALAARVRAAARACASLTHPLVALPMWLGVYYAWHFPPVYDYALRHPDSILHLEHASYFVTGAAMWWPVLHDSPRRLSSGIKAGYLFAAFVLASPIGLLLALAGHPLYDFYAHRAGAALGPLAPGRPAGRGADDGRPSRRSSSSPSSPTTSSASSTRRSRSRLLQTAVDERRVRVGRVVLPEHDDVLVRRRGCRRGRCSCRGSARSRASVSADSCVVGAEGQRHEVPVLAAQVGAERCRSSQSIATKSPVGRRDPRRPPARGSCASWRANARARRRSRRGRARRGRQRSGGGAGHGGSV